MDPLDIERESFRIILGELGPHSFSAQELPVVQRVIHATADFEYARLLVFAPQAIDAGLAALGSGCTLFADVQMAAIGINRRNLGRLGGNVRCLLADSETVALAESAGITRAAAAIRRVQDDLTGSIVVIGNAPTALLELLRLVQNDQVRPALVIGVPVGFVNAAESKAALVETDLAYIATRGRKGGSGVAAAIVNALMLQAVA